MHTNSYTIRPVFKAMHMVRVLGLSKREMSLSEIAAATQMPRSTAYKYLRTMCDSGFLVHNKAGDTYRMGLLMWEMSQIPHDIQQVRDLAKPAMQQLRERFDETVNFAVLEGTDVIYLEIVHSERTLRMQAVLGGRYPAYQTGLGKAMLAFIAPEDRQRHLPATLIPQTPSTIVSLPDLDRALMRVRQVGYSLDHGEIDDGINCVAAPLFGSESAVVGAVSIASPSSRMNGRREQEMAAGLLAATREVSQRLGYLGPAFRTR